MVLWWDSIFVIFPAVKLKRIYLLEIYSKSHLTLSNSISKCPQLHSNRFLWARKTYSRAPNKFCFFSPSLKKSLSNFVKHIGGSLKRIGNLSSAFKKADSQREQSFKCHLESWQGTPINIISPSVFHLYSVGMSMATSHQRRILKIQKPLDVLI